MFITFFSKPWTFRSSGDFFFEVAHLQIMKQKCAHIQATHLLLLTACKVTRIRFFLILLFLSIPVFKMCSIDTYRYLRLLSWIPAIPVSILVIPSVDTYENGRQQARNHRYYERWHTSSIILVVQHDQHTHLTAAAKTSYYWMISHITFSLYCQLYTQSLWENLIVIRVLFEQSIQF